MPKISDGLLTGFDQEMLSTHRLLECLPDDRLDFKPHPRSMALDVLAGHVAQLPKWAHYAIERDSLDIAPADGPPQAVRFVAGSRDEALARFHIVSKEARELIAEVSDEDLEKPWSLLFTGRTVFSMPRAEVLRTWFLNHMIHHRAQLGVYLRLLDIPIPGM